MAKDHIEDHDRGLAFDLETISRKMLERRRALALLGGAGMGALLVGCGGGGDSSDSSSTTTASTTSTTSTSTTTTTTTDTSTSTGTTTTTTSGSCVDYATETNGPYPADGTNTSSGSTSNVLTASGVVRSDIRSSFISSTTTATGVQLTLTITLNNSTGCTPLSGYAIYIWHCDANGEYSLYDLPTESYLRGVQVSDSNGQVTFTTIVPGCYTGRYPHIHFEVFTSLSAATSGTGRTATLISQFAVPADICSTVYAAGGYGNSTRALSQITLATDNVFGDNTAAQIAAQTLTMSGSVSAGYTATVTVGV
jgi:protocatechuate 3,4-dioxygenase beta subunit